jgi:hypothetical protein
MKNITISAALAMSAGFLLSSPVDAIPPVRDSILVQGPLFRDTCNDNDPIRHSACVGFIAGVANSYLNSGQTCISANTDPKEVTDFVRYYMNSNANLVNQPAVSVVLLALKARYPCTRPMFQPFQFSGF